MKDEADLKDRIFDFYCYTSTDLMDPSGGLISSIHCAKRLQISKYMARKVIHELVEEGLLVKGHYGGLSDWDWCVHCYHGFAITRKAKETSIYRRAAYRSAKIAAECFGGHTIEYYKTFTKNYAA